MHILLHKEWAWAAGGGGFHAIDGDNFYALTHILREGEIREIDEGHVKEVSQWIKCCRYLHERERR